MAHFLLFASVLNRLKSKPLLIGSIIFLQPVQVLHSFPQFAIFFNNPKYYSYRNGCKVKVISYYRNLVNSAN